MWTCPKCEREIVHANKWHYCEKVSLDSLFDGKKEELSLVFDRILSHVITWENVGVSATKNCIVFVHHQTFLVIKPMKTVLNLKFYSAGEKTGFPVLKSTPVSGKFENIIRISEVDELSADIIKHIKDSYELL